MPLENFGRLGQEVSVDARALAADRHRTLQLFLEGALIGLVVTPRDRRDPRLTALR